MALLDILGHEEVKKEIKEAHHRGKLPHALLFAGPPGVGKKLTAFALAKVLNCAEAGDDSCDRCQSCRKIDKMCHPDVMLLEPQGDFIKIDQVRWLREELYYRPYEGKVKVAILDGADKMRKEAANALLKTLEEPPLGTALFLICNDASALLPTIRSRCRLFKFKPIEEESIARALSEAGIADSKAKIAAALSGGGYARAFQLGGAESFQARDSAISLMKESSLDEVDLIFQRSRRLAKNGTEAEQIIEYIQALARDVAFLKSSVSDAQLMNLDKIADIEGLAKVLTAEGALSVFDCALETGSLLRRNVNAQLALDVLMIKIALAKRARSL